MEENTDTLASVEEALEHIGIIRRSGRYPWGSGDTPYQRSKDFKAFVKEMKEDWGLTDTEIRAALMDEHGNPMSSTDFRAATAVSTDQIFANNVATAVRLKNEYGHEMSTSAIARQMGTRESTVRGWLKASEDRKVSALQATVDTLKQNIEDKTFLDVGKGTEHYMGIAESKLRTAISALRDEGYKLHLVKGPQLGTEHMTEYKILTKEDKTWHDAKTALNQGKVLNIKDHSDDGGLTFKTPLHTPVSVSSKRVEVNYRETGGDKMDGVIELRRGVPDLSLGGKAYAQVRIAVDGTHYLKGMAMHGDDLPPGIDIRFNTNKSAKEVTSKFDAMKPMTDDPSNRFGATTHPKVYLDKGGNEKTSALNIVGSKDKGNEEGKWDEWSKSLSSQMLSKQSISLASTQLGKTQAAMKKDLKEISALTNPVVKKKLLLEFAESADAAASHLKAAHMSGQSNHVILPIKTMRPNEVYAPNYPHGSKVVLVRYPHGGPFEIPELTVNNRNLTAKRILGAAKDAVGIHFTAAEQLSGADFDGDSILVIPNNDRRVKSAKPLTELKDFAPKVLYKIPDNDTTTPRMTKQNTQTEMGKISNLITDMTIKGAPHHEIARAIKHSMVVIDAEKHGLNYKQSAADHNIKQLKSVYQKGPTKGAATLLSRASAEQRVPQRKYITGDRGIDPKTGERRYTETGAKYPKTTSRVSKRTGEVVTKTKIEDKTTKLDRMTVAKDARELLSDRKNPKPMEEVYASHANTMKALANQARKESVAVKMPRQNPKAKALYAKEVESLNHKLKIAELNAPIERRAQTIGRAIAKARIDESSRPLEKDEIVRIKHQELERARIATGANKIKVDITPNEWTAIQAGAIAATRLGAILRHAPKERVRELATPRSSTSLTPGQLARARSMVSSGKTMSEVAAALGIPRTTISDNLAR